LHHLRILTVFSLILFCSVTSAFAELDKGRFMLGGQFSVAETTSEADPDEKLRSRKIQPNLAYFLSEHLSLGLGLGIEGEPGENGLGILSTTVINPTVRHYISINKKFAYYTELSGAISFGSFELNDNSSHYNRTDLGLSPNFLYFLDKDWALELGLTGLAYTLEQPEGDDNNTTHLKFNISFKPQIGLKFFI
jgi:hypothetical protein